MSDFVKELEGLINKYSLENGSNTPDFILAQYLAESLGAFNRSVVRRDKCVKFDPWDKDNSLNSKQLS